MGTPTAWTAATSDLPAPAFCSSSLPMQLRYITSHSPCRKAAACLLPCTPVLLPFCSCLTVLSLQPGKLPSPLPVSYQGKELGAMGTSSLFVCLCRRVCNFWVCCTSFNLIGLESQREASKLIWSLPSGGEGMPVRWSPPEAHLEDCQRRICSLFKPRAGPIAHRYAMLHSNAKAGVSVWWYCTTACSFCKKA